MKRYRIQSERPHLFDTSILIAMQISVEGITNENVLRNAFSKALNANEIFSTHIVINENGEAFFETADLPPLSENIFFVNEDKLDIIRREEKRRFAVEKGEYIKAYCTKLTNEGFDMLFLMHHIAGDGKSLVYFIESFMKALNNEQPEYREMRLIPIDTDKKSLKASLGASYYFSEYYNSKWEHDKKKQAFGFEDMDDAYDQFWADKCSSIDEFEILPEKVNKILETCRSLDIGFTAYIITAFCRYLGKMCDIGIAMNARTDENRAMGNQATGISVKYTYKNSLSFKDKAVKIQKLMNDKLNDDNKRNFLLPFLASLEPTLTDSLNLEHAGSFRSKTSSALGEYLGYGKKTKDISVTNLTRLDIPDTYGKYKISGFTFIPPVISNSKTVIGISTLNDKTMMTVHRLRISRPDNT